jgi:hypothetical protein
MRTEVYEAIMPIHDWTRVSAGTFHDFHNAWITELRNACNGGLLPAGYYALGEQHAGHVLTDVLTLHRPDGPARNGGTASEAGAIRAVRRTLTIRHSSGHRVVALLEILSPANKDRPRSIADFVDKAVSALKQGIHLLVVDLFPPGRHDPQGMHAQIWQDYGDELDAPPPDKPLILASYLATALPEAFLEFVKVGDALPSLPLFLDDDYVPAPLLTTYEAAYRGVPDVWREVLERAGSP